MKVLVLSCSTGGGHNACGIYIRDEFKKNGIACDFINYFDIIGKNASRMAEKIYLQSTTGNGGLFKSVYKLGELYNKMGFTSPVYSLNKLAKQKLKFFIETNNYSLVVCTHIFPAMTVTALKKSDNNIPLINVATDYEIIPFWDETSPDYFVIPSSLLLDKFKEKGFLEETLLPFGIPVGSDFIKVKNDLDLPKDKNIVLITSGSMGFGKIKEMVVALLDNIDNVYLVVICGNNNNLYLDLLELKRDNLLVKGFINNMKEFIKVSDVVLTKPGGLTSTEVAIMNKPMVHIMPIPGVENYNAMFFSNNGLSLVSNTVEEVVSKTQELLNNKKLQEDMKKKQKKVINKNSAKDLVLFVKEKFQ